MQYSEIELSGRPLSKIGFGAMGFAGWFGVQDEADAVRALHHALDRGVTVVDTARAYGASESVVGRALRSWHGEQPVIATKVEPLGRNRQWGVPVEVTEVFPPGQVRASAERSLRELGRDRIDVLQLHLWWPTWGLTGYWMDELLSLREEGLVGHLGVSLPDHRSDLALALIDSGAFESLQTIVNVFDPLALDVLAPMCHERGIALLARCVLDEGGLTGAVTAETEFPADDYRHGYFDATIPREVYLEKVEELRALVPEHAPSLAALALKYVTQSPGVASALTSMHQLGHASANVAAVDGPDLPDEIVDLLRTHHRFVKNFNHPNHWK